MKNVWLWGMMKNDGDLVVKLISASIFVDTQDEVTREEFVMCLCWQKKKNHTI